MASYPEHLQYSREHEWVDAPAPASGKDSQPAVIGVTSLAADALGDVVYLELPEVGAEVEAGAVVGEIESTKSVSELYSPVTGTVVEVNQAVIEDPALVNADPFGAGWLFKVEVVSLGELLDAAAYAELAE